MNTENISSLESNILLLSVVKILSDNGLKKTLKKLRKETKYKYLREENLPDFIANADFKKLLPKLLKKTIKSDKNKKRKSEKNGTLKVSTEDSMTIAGFVKSSQILEGTIETPKKDDCVDYITTSTSSSAESISNVVSSENKLKITSKNGTKSGVPFKRINEDVWLSKIDREELKDNTYKVKNGSFALKDAEELSLVKGKDFRSQKYKKKRSSWKGSGEITNSINSVIFSDSDS